MNTANLDLLGIELPIGISTYHDLGKVKSMPRCTVNLMIEHGLKNKYYQPTKDQLCIGRFMPIRTDIYIFYRDDLTGLYLIQARAHEQTHVLEHQESLGLLEERMSERQNIDVRFKKITHTEIRANLGSIFALEEQGVDYTQIPNNVPELMDLILFRRAYEIYSYLKGKPNFIKRWINEV